jgi:O-antigen/teichoic acid export membrane protein
VRIDVFGRHFFKSDYWVGTPIVPWVLLAYVFNGAYVVFVAGAYLEKKTRYLPLITGLGALVNIVVNFLLVPSMGIMGAALATLAAYAVMAGTMYFASQKFYKVEYEWGKVAGAVCAAAIAFAGYEFFHPIPLTANGAIIKVGLLCVFLILLPAFGVFSKSDMAIVKSTAQRYLSSRNSS